MADDETNISAKKGIVENSKKYWEVVQRRDFANRDIIGSIAKDEEEARKQLLGAKVNASNQEVNAQEQANK